VATASLTSGGASASDNKVYAGDDVRLDTTSALGTFSAGKQVGVNKTVAVSGLALSGLDAGNYRVTDASGAVASITAKDVTVSGITAANKVYDATSVATLNVTGAALSAGAASASDNKVYASDDVRLNASGATGSFAAGKNVGTAQAVTVSGLTLSGTDAGNYRVTDASGAVASITAKDVTTQGILALSRAYDGSDVASLNLNGLMLVSGASSATDNRVYAGDQVSVNTTAVTGAFTGGKNVGTGKAVAINGLALNGADAGNYRVSDASGAAASITPKSLVMTGTSVDNKTYDATTAANVQMGTLNGLVGVETVTVTALGAFDARQAGPRSAQVSYTLADGANGGLASNYSLPDAVGLTAVIAPKPVTVTGIIASHKVYDATSTASLNTSGATLTTGAAQASDNKVYASDDVGVNVSGASGVFVAGKNVGVGKAVSVSGLALSGADAANYRVSDASGATANITPKAVTSQGITAANKVYDATQVATLDVRGAALMTGASTAQDNKVYASDDVRLQTSGATGIFAAGKNVGVSKAVSVSGLTLSGADAANYLVTDASGATASITAKAVTASGITALNKVYDANDVASLNVSGVTLTPGAAAASDNKVYASDDVRVSTAAVAGVLVDGKNVGTGKPVAISGLTLSGADASNYTVSDASGATANVSPKWVDATGVTASGKYFDGTSNASLNTQGAVITGGATHANDGKYYSADNVRLNTAASSGVFAAGALPGVGKAVNVQGLALTGADAGNYRVVDASNAQASIKLWEGLSSCSIGAGCAVASPMRVSMVAPQVSKQPVQALAYQSAAASSVGSVPAMLATLSPDNPVNLPLVRSLSVQDVASLSTRQLAQAMPYLSASQWMALSPAQMEGLSDAQRALALQRQDVARQVLPLSAAQIMSLPVDGVATYLRLFSQTQLQSLTSAQLQSLSPSQQAERAAMLQALSR
jgi:hypothetical protein